MREVIRMKKKVFKKRRKQAIKDICNNTFVIGKFRDIFGMYDYDQEEVSHVMKTMIKEFIDKGYKIISDGTDNHLMLIDLRAKFPDLTGRLAEKELVKADITVNKNMVPFDTRSAFATSGLRVGTPAITSRGFEEKDMVQIVELIDSVLSSANAEALGAKEPTAEQKAQIAAHQEVLEEVKRKVHMMTAGRPLNRY